MQIPKFSLWICAVALCGGMTLRADDTPAQAAARAALMQKLQEVDGHPAPTPQTPAPVTPTPAATAPASAPASAPTSAPTPVMAPATTPAATVSVTPVAGDTPAQAEARAALYQKMADLGIPMHQTAAPTAPVATKAPASQPTATAAPVVTKNSDATLQRIPMVAPALPISAAKEEKLRMLLAHYQADQISPEQYHEQRAAILAAP